AAHPRLARRRQAAEHSAPLGRHRPVQLSLEAKLTVRAEPDELERRGIRLTVDQNEIRLDVAVSMILPFAGKRMVEVPMRQWFVGGQKLHGRHEFGIEAATVPPRFFSSVVALELSGALNRPHSGSPTTHRAS